MTSLQHSETWMHQNQTVNFLPKNIDTEEKKKLLEGKDKLSTQHATNRHVDQFRHFLLVQNLPKPEDITNLKILYNLYSSVKPQKR